MLADHAIEIFETAIRAVHPKKLMSGRIAFRDGQLLLDEEKIAATAGGKIVVFGFGKASAAMAVQLEAITGDAISGGLVITKYGHGTDCRHITVREAGHPVLDENGISATKELVEMAENLGENDLAICLISGGGSALLEQLPDGISLVDLQQTTELLLGCGASINEMNAVRKHISRVKGGQLARAIFPARCISLMISDVIGDPPDVIASGPTSPDNTSFSDALQVIDKYELIKKIPDSVRQHLLTGFAGKIAENPQSNDPVFNRINHRILGSNTLALQAAASAAKHLGYNVTIVTSELQGEAREAAQKIAAIANDVQQLNQPIPKPACVLFGGETTVTLLGNGKGGRNQEFALAALLEMGESDFDYLIFSGGTDGTDGPTDAAGAFASPTIWQIAREKGIDPQDFLNRNDAYHFFEQTGGLVKTGPTGTNVMDVGMILVR
ncbi:MAG: glycerate kinase [Calditrichaeota bacterium]|nr:glycerate kinase [Calditrichota bacterium]